MSFFGNSSHCKQFYIMFTQCFCQENNKQLIMASSLIKPDSVQFHFWCTVIIIPTTKMVCNKPFRIWCFHLHQQNFDVQWTMGLFGVTHICNLKDTIPAASFNMVNKNTFTLIQWEKYEEPPPSTYSTLVYQSLRFKLLCTIVHVQSNM